MGLAISVTKSETLDSVSADKLNDLCAAIIQEENHVVYVPRAGKLKEVLSVFQARNITYSLKNDQIDA